MTPSVGPAGLSVRPGSHFSSTFSSRTWEGHQEDLPASPARNAHVPVTWPRVVWMFCSSPPLCKYGVFLETDPGISLFTKASARVSTSANLR